MTADYSQITLRQIRDVGEEVLQSFSCGRSLYERFGVFNTRYRIAADYDLMLRVLSQLSGKVMYLPEVLVRMRMGGVRNRSLSNIVRKSWEDYQALRTNRVGGLGALAWKNLSKLPQFSAVRAVFAG